MALFGWLKRNTQPTDNALFKIGDAVAYTLHTGNVLFGTIVDTDSDLQWVKVKYVQDNTVYTIWDSVQTVETFPYLMELWS